MSWVDIRSEECGEPFFNFSDVLLEWVPWTEFFPCMRHDVVEVSCAASEVTA